MNRKSLLTTLMLVFSTPAVMAYMPGPMPGTGAWGAMQGCQHDYVSAEAILSGDSEIGGDYSDAKTEYARAKAAYNEAKKEFNSKFKPIKKVLKKSASAQVEDYLKGIQITGKCHEVHAKECDGFVDEGPSGPADPLANLGRSRRSSSKNEIVDSKNVIGDFCQRGSTSRTEFQEGGCVNLWRAYEQSGALADLCNNEGLTKKRTNDSKRDKCIDAMNELVDELDSGEDSLFALRQAMRDAEEEMNTAEEDARENLAKSERYTEGHCEDCYRRVRDSYDLLGSAIGLVAHGYLINKAVEAQEDFHDKWNKYRIDMNARAGWPSAQNYGYPYYNNQIYGSILGGMAGGAFGCAGGIGVPGFGLNGLMGLGGTSLGYPGSYYHNPYWGPFNQSAAGWGPMGVGGPFGAYGGSPFTPGFGSGFPGAGGFPGGIGMGGPFGGMGGPYGTGLGYPGIGGPFGGAGFPGGVGMGGPFGGPFGGGFPGAGGFPGGIGMGGPFGGMGGPYGTGLGYPGMGGPFGGGFPGGVGTGGPFGGAGGPFAGMGGPFGGMGSPYGGMNGMGMLNPQYQQQMLAQQQQQQQQMMDYYQRQTQNQMRAMQTITDLSSQIQRLQGQIYSTYSTMGYGSNGMGYGLSGFNNFGTTGFGTYNNYMGIGTGTGSPTSGFGPAPAPGYNSNPQSPR